jgi:hypothetical protein
MILTLTLVGTWDDDKRMHATGTVAASACDVIAVGSNSWPSGVLESRVLVFLSRGESSERNHVQRNLSTDTHDNFWHMSDTS